jgi:hypothetical protein
MGEDVNLDELAALTAMTTNDGSFPKATSTNSSYEYPETPWNAEIQCMTLKSPDTRR